MVLKFGPFENFLFSKKASFVLQRLILYYRGLVCTTKYQFAAQNVSLSYREQYFVLQSINLCNRVGVSIIGYQIRKGGEQILK